MRTVKEFLDGLEYTSEVPVEVPAGFRRPLTMEERLQKYIRTELSRRAAADGVESFEEADDFEVEDEEEFISPYELHEMQEEFVLEPKAAPQAPAKGEEDAAKVAEKPEESGT